MVSGGWTSLLVDLDANLAAGRADDGAPSALDYGKTMLSARFIAVFLHRSAVAARSVPLLPLAIKQLNQFLTGAEISPEAQIGVGLVLYHPNGVVIGAGARIGTDASLQQGVTVGGLGGPRRHGVMITAIGDRVFLGAGCRIIGEITVGDDVIVGANAVVTKDVPSFSIAVGVPARSRPRADRDGEARVEGRGADR